MNTAPSSCEFPEPELPSSGCWRIPKLLFVAVVLVLAAVIYSPVRNYEFINFDDGAYIADNPMLRDGFTPTSVQWAFVANLSEPSQYAEYWEPLTLLSRIADVSVYGFDAGMHHVSNVMIHILNTLLLSIALWRLTGQWNRSAFVALLFLVHPMNVEAVCWLSARKDVLSATFSFVTLIAYAYYARRPSLRRYGVLLAAFIASLMAKPMGVSLPLILLALDFWPLGRWKKAEKNRESQILLVLEKLPLFLLACAISIFAVVSQGENGGLRGSLAYPLTVRICNALIAYVTYLRRIFWPSDLAIFYLHPGRDISYIAALLSGILLVAIFATIYLRRRSAPYALTGWLWFGLALGPVIGLVQIGSQSMADRYAYPSTIGIFIALTWGMAELLRKWPAVLAGVGSLSVVAMAIVSIPQVKTWQNSVTLFRHDLEVAGPSAVAYDDLAEGLFSQHRYDEALPYLEKRRDTYSFDPKSWANLAAVHYITGNKEEAMKLHKEALRRNPKYLPSLIAVSDMDVDIGKTEEARKLLEYTLREFPGDRDATLRLGQIYTKDEQWSEALRVWDAYLHLHPGEPYITMFRKSAKDKFDAQTAGVPSLPDTPSADSPTGPPQ